MLSAAIFVWRFMGVLKRVLKHFLQIWFNMFLYNPHRKLQTLAQNIC